MSEDPMLYYQEQIEDWTEMMHESEDCKSKRFYQRLIKSAQKKNAAYQRVMFAFLETGVGLTLARKGQWALILPDASEPGRYRYQLFDESGFIGHVVRDSGEETVKEAFIEGFREVAEGDVLATLSKTDKWKVGTLRNDLISQVNRGQITHEEANRRYLSLAA